MGHPALFTVAVVLFAASACGLATPLETVQGDCLTLPGDSTWPSEADWQKFSREVDGQLIKSVPRAASCHNYEGKSPDPTACADIFAKWKTEKFQTQSPLGRWFPWQQSCPPVNMTVSDDQAHSCWLGQLPAYTVDARKHEHVAAALKFAKERRLRVSIVTTGHDLNGRADGAGVLAIWMRNLRGPIEFLVSFVGCSNAVAWSGSAIKIGGGYQWDDVIAVASQHKTIVVTGGAGSVGATGGWVSGGGHGPASRNYGLGADQMLEAEVMLADGSIVTANHCQNQDLFRALRGGGPGYGVVLSTTVKAYPEVSQVVVHKLDIKLKDPSGNEAFTKPELADLDAKQIDALHEAVAVMLENNPRLNEKGYAGYASWWLAGNASAYTHKYWTIDMDLEHTEQIFGEAADRLFKIEGLAVESSFVPYPSYWDFFNEELSDPLLPGDTLLLSSRFVGDKHVRDPAAVRQTVNTISGRHFDGGFNMVLLVSGGKVFEDKVDASSGLNPAWRTSPMVLLSARNVGRKATPEQRREMAKDLTEVRGQAAKALAPDTGGYVNEGDREDPDWIETFYGQENYIRHLETKNKYDPDGLFYCPTCVGSDSRIEDAAGRLCVRQS